MLGCTGTGCFVVGIVTGFILAGVLGLLIFFHFNPDVRESSLSAVRRVWTSVRSGVDSTLDTPAKPGPTPPPEPQIPQAKPAPAPALGASPRSAAPAAAPRTEGQPLPRARIEINL